MSETKYVFWIELEDGQEVRWSHLSLRQVQSMNAVTDKRLPLNIKAFGWSEMR
jgi:hypothetical protein